MRLARLHRRLLGLMSLAALGALAAGAGVAAWMLPLAAAIVLGLFWTPEPRLAGLIERGSRAVAVGIFVWVLYVGLIARGDSLSPSLVLLLVLVAGEMLRPLEAPNDYRLYALAFALLLASTAYYPGIAFGVAFTVYVVLTTLALMVGHLRRQAERFHIADLRIDRSFLATTAALSGITLLTSVTIFLAFPRLPRSWFGQGRPAAGNFVGFGDAVSLAEYGGRLRGNPEVVFRVEFPDGVPRDASDLYWRGASFDHFDGVRWSRTRGGWSGVGLLPPFPYQTRWGGPRQEYRVYGGPPGVRVLFGPHPVLGVRAHSAIRPRYRANGDLVYDGWDAPVYTVRSGPALPPEALLRGVPEGPAPEGERYLQLPPLAPRVARLADSLTHLHPVRLDRVRAVERWLREEFRYTLELPASAREATLEHFLFERRAGHCEYFSTAMAVLLRAAGIPARNVNGFLGGEWNERGSYLAVTGNGAHSWVEAWFPELGWVPFDPTPAADREEVLVSAGSSGVWPVLFWLDSVQFQWYRLVLAYDLERQLDLLRALGDQLSPDEPGGRRPDAVPWRHIALWLLGPLGAACLAWLLTRRGGAPAHAAETRLYLALRGSYARAGYPVRATDTPLAFLDRLRAAEAPALTDADWVVQRYLRARFAGEALAEEERAAMKARLAAARQALRG